MPLVRYSALRLALLAACWAALWLAGMHVLAAALVGALVAWAVSYVALAGPRDDAALYLAQRAERRRAGSLSRLETRLRDDDAAEDAAVDAALASPARGDRAPADGEPDDEGQSASPSPSSTP